MPFGEIIGHTRQIRILQSALKAGKLPHAYLFEGQDGVGKRKVALALAQAVQCERHGEDACGKCLPCQKVEDYIHPDVWWLAPEKNSIRIDVIRELQKDMSFEALEGNHRVVIIDEAEKMLHNAANAMLKILEEPPSATTMVLITPTPQQLLPTIVSRCQRLAFGPLTKEMARKVIAKHMEDDQRVVNLLASLSGGSPGRAMAFGRELFLDERPRFIEWVGRCSLDRVQDIFQLSEKLDKKSEKSDTKREEILFYLEILRGWYRDVAVYHVTQNSEQLVNADLVAGIQKASEQIPLRLAISRFETIGETLRDLERNANVRLALDTMLLKLYALEAGNAHDQKR
jgi:DNA polymerase-3 subunit delta'